MDTLKVNDKVFFFEEKTPYTVRACNDRYAICTRPYNPQRTVLYTIIDFKEKVRGPNNYVFNIYDYKDQRDINKSLKDLDYEKYEISYRHRVALNIINVIRTHQKKDIRNKYEAFPINDYPRYIDDLMDVKGGREGIL